MLRSLLLATILLGLAGCRSDAYQTQPPDPEWLHASMKQLTDVMVHDIFSPPQASRTYAYPSIAAYEVLAQGSDEYASLAGQLNELNPVPAPPAEEIYLPLAAIEAFLKVGQALVFTEDEIAQFRAKIYEQIRDTGVPSGVFERSVAYGDTVAAHILAWAHEDGYNETRAFPKYTVTEEIGRWQPTPPAYLDAIEPHWNKHRPFVMDSAAQFVPPPPPPFDMTEGSDFYQLADEVYEVGTTLTEEQRAIAAFWDCNPYVMHTRGHVMFATKKITPGGHWIGITAIAARQAGSSFIEAAEAYARVSVALADAFIASWDEKYRSNLIRPETVINRYIDEDWVPVLQTPPFPEHTSGHSVISTAAAHTLTDLYGDGFAFDDTTEVEYGLPVRSYGSFLEASQEAAISRLYGGIHYRPAIDDGIVQGEQVGRLVIGSVRTRAPMLADEPEAGRATNDAP